MRLFDVLGPVMIGPSSSHTAGAAKIGYTAQKLLGDIPAEADIGLYVRRYQNLFHCMHKILLQKYFL